MVLPNQKNDLDVMIKSSIRFLFLFKGNLVKIIDLIYLAFFAIVTNPMPIQLLHRMRC